MNHYVCADCGKVCNEMQGLLDHKKNDHQKNVIESLREYKQPETTYERNPSVKEN